MTRQSAFGFTRRSSPISKLFVEDGEILDPSCLAAGGFLILLTPEEIAAVRQ